MHPILRTFLRNIELWLSGAGLLVVLATSAIIAPDSADVWKVAAITALAVSVLHGVLFWVVRERQRRLRAQAIAELREMLADLVKNQLAVIGMYLPSSPEAEELEMQVAGIKESVAHIEHLVDTISEESIQDWKSRYDQTIQEGAVPMFG